MAAKARGSARIERSTQVPVRFGNPVHDAEGLALTILTASAGMLRPVTDDTRGRSA